MSQHEGKIESRTTIDAKSKVLYLQERLNRIENENAMLRERLLDNELKHLHREKITKNDDTILEHHERVDGKMGMIRLLNQLNKLVKDESNNDATECEVRESMLKVALRLENDYSDNKNDLTVECNKSQIVGEAIGSREIEMQYSSKANLSTLSKYFDIDFDTRYKDAKGTNCLILNSDASKKVCLNLTASTVKDIKHVLNIPVDENEYNNQDKRLIDVYTLAEANHMLLNERDDFVSEALKLKNLNTKS